MESGILAICVLHCVATSLAIPYRNQADDKGSEASNVECDIENGVQYSGFDYRSALFAADMTACKQKCISDYPRCAGFTFQETRHCWLKTRMDKQTESNRHVSGICKGSVQEPLPAVNGNPATLEPVAFEGGKAYATSVANLAAFPDHDWSAARAFQRQPEPGPEEKLGPWLSGLISSGVLETVYYKFSYNLAVGKFSFRNRRESGHVKNNPSMFDFVGSNDCSSWKILKAVDWVVWQGNDQEQSWQIEENNRQDFNCYGIQVRAISGSYHVAIQDVKMWKVASASASATTEGFNFTNSVNHQHNKVYAEEEKDTERVTECCRSCDCSDYRGEIATTASGRKCQSWDSDEPHKRNFFKNIKGDKLNIREDAGLHKNFCRNPSGHGTAWCYTMDTKKTWENCDIPRCSECCLTPDCSDYRGTKATTASGRKCQPWKSDSPHYNAHRAKMIGLTTRSGLYELSENFCRNPTGHSTAWCYTMDPYKKWEECDIPKCSDAEAPEARAITAACSKKPYCGLSIWSDYPCDVNSDNNYGCKNDANVAGAVFKPSFGYCWRSCDEGPRCAKYSKDANWCWCQNLASDWRKSWWNGEEQHKCWSNAECLNLAQRNCPCMHGGIFG